MNSTYKVKVVPTCSGSQYRIDYVKNFDDNGVPYLEECGKTDLQALYDSKRDDCDLASILKTMIASGVDLGSVKFDDDIEDITPLQHADPSEVHKNLSNFDSLLAEYEAKIADLKAKADNIDNSNNGGDSHVE